ncbi:MAG: isochorismatase family cysteine hydrolase [Anaerolineales bacterium]
MNAQQFIKDSEPFLNFLAGWAGDLPELTLASLTAEPGRLAIISVDVINGFCTTGALASPRIQAIVAPIAGLFQRAQAAGVEYMALVQEAHEPDAVEFAHYPRHAVRGSREAEAVPELKALPFYDQLPIFTKNSISPVFNSGLEAWLQAHPQISTFVAVGDCTDLCTYQLAMYLRLRANANQLDQRVIVPVNCTDTFDTPLDVARQIGALPHAGDLLHWVFLYNMRLNGVEVVQAIV